MALLTSVVTFPEFFGKYMSYLPLKTLVVLLYPCKDESSETEQSGDDYDVLCDDNIISNLVVMLIFRVLAYIYILPLYNSCILLPFLLLVHINVCVDSLAFAYWTLRH